jgi:hypothetical protein
VTTKPPARKPEQATPHPAPNLLANLVVLTPLPDVPGARY